MDDILIPLSDRDFKRITELVYSRFGIHLSEQKKTLVTGRLSKRIRQLGLASFTDYLHLLENDRPGLELVEFINRMTTNHSYFYREKDHFEYLQSYILPELKKKLDRQADYPLRIWSAGCATGEEAYTLSMIVLESLGQQAALRDWGILATDISRAALESALQGIYPEARIKELPAAWKTSYLQKCGDDAWSVKDLVGKNIMFKRLNLMNENFPFKGKFDVVFCRNVMIYFDVAVRKKLVNRIFRYIKNGGYLFVGHSESLPRDSCPFTYVRPAVYRKESPGE